MAPRAKPRVLALFLADGCLSAGQEGVGGGSEVGWVGGGREWVRFAVFTNGGRWRGRM